jgi:hypothetical protein
MYVSPRFCHLEYFYIKPPKDSLVVAQSGLARLTVVARSNFEEVESVSRDIIITALDAHSRSRSWNAF